MRLLWATCCLILSLVAASHAVLFHAPHETRQWRDYYSPYGKNSAFFEQDTLQKSARQLLIGCGLGRTGTTTIYRTFLELQVQSHHFDTVTAKVGQCGQSSNTTCWHDWPDDPTLGLHEGPIALSDYPMHQYVWDLVDAFPNSSLGLSVREADSWIDSRIRLALTMGKLEGRTARELALTTRADLRKFFQHNSHVISSSYFPEPHTLKFTIIDFTKPGASLSFSRFAGVYKDVGHHHKSKAETGKSVSKAVSTRHLQLEAAGNMPLEEAAPNFNPQGLSILQYMTPMAHLVPGHSRSKLWFLGAPMTSSHPLIIAAGYEGTGLQALQAALNVVRATGHFRARSGNAGNVVTLPTFPIQACSPGGEGSSKLCRIRLKQLRGIHANGFQTLAALPRMLDSVTAVLGHPVPLLFWDFLEAFPSGKVVLTVRDVDVMWQALSYIAPGTGVMPAHTHAGLVDWWVWASRGNFDKRKFVRQYLRHNSAVIHGVPAAQLLVWDVYKQPEWGPLCEFLGVPVPDVPFPAPLVNEF